MAPTSDSLLGGGGWWSCATRKTDKRRSLQWGSSLFFPPFHPKSSQTSLQAGCIETLGSTSIDASARERERERISLEPQSKSPSSCQMSTKKSTISWKKNMRDRMPKRVQRMEVLAQEAEDLRPMRFAVGNAGLSKEDLHTLWTS